MPADEDSSISSSSDEVRPLYLEDTGSLREQSSDGLADLTKVTSTSIAGLVVEDLIDSISRKGAESEEEGEEDRNVPNYSAALAHVRTNGSSRRVQPSASDISDNDGYLIPQKQVKIIIYSLFSLSFLASLDATILSTLVTDIASDLGAIQYISWITTAYLLSMSIVQPLGGLSDIFGREPMLYGCIIIYIIGCFQCAMAHSTSSFVLGRFFSGFAGGLTTLGTIIMSDLVPLRQRGVYQGLGNMCYGLGSTVGGTFGGWVAHRFGWRMAFWCQVPYGIICLFIIALTLKLPESLKENNPYHKLSLWQKFNIVDGWGIFFLAAMLSIFIVASSFTFQHQIYTWCMGIAFILAAMAFFVSESMAKAPIVPMNLLKDRSVLGCSLANMFGTMYTFVILYYFPVYLSSVSGLNTEEIGIRVVPTVISLALSSVFSGYYMKWTGKYWTYSLIVNIIGSAGLTILLCCTFPFGLKRQITIFEQYMLCVPALISYSAMLTVTLLALIAAVPMTYQASVTSIQYAFRGIGSVLGTSMGSKLFTVSLRKEMVKKVTAVKPSEISDKELSTVIKKALNSVAYIRTEAPKWGITAMIESYGISCWTSFMFSTCVSILCLFSMVMIKEYRLYSSVKRNK